MLTATEFYPIDSALQVVLWIEVIVYLGLGIFELFDDFMQKPKPWMVINGRTNGYVHMTHKIGRKMHAGICFVLGFVALNGIIEGHVTRFELELIFVSLGILMPAVLACLLPGRLAFIILVSKPEFWLQIVMFSLFSHLVRPEVLALCIFLNIWGIVVYLFHTRRKMFVPFTYEQVRADCMDAEGETLVRRLDKMAGFTPHKETAE